MRWTPEQQDAAEYAEAEYRQALEDAKEEGSQAALARVDNAVRFLGQGFSLTFEPIGCNHGYVMVTGRDKTIRVRVSGEENAAEVFLNIVEVFEKFLNKGKAAE